jgi:hypothetical protein
MLAAVWPGPLLAFSYTSHLWNDTTPPPSALRGVEADQSGSYQSQQCVVFQPFRAPGLRQTNATIKRANMTRAKGFLGSRLDDWEW